MRINFGSCYTLVPQHSLYHAQVRTTLKQVCGERMAERMWAYILLYAHSLDQFLNHMEHSYARQRFLKALTDEHIILIAPFYLYPVTVLEVRFNLGYRTFRYGHKALFTALSRDTQEALRNVQVGETQATKLGHTQATAIEHLNDGPVPLSFVGSKIYCIDYIIDFLQREDIGQAHSNLGRHEQRGGVIGNIPVKQQKAIE